MAIERKLLTAEEFAALPDDRTWQELVNGKVRTSSDRPGEIREKIEHWLDVGVRPVWVLDPARRTVSVHRRGEPPRTLRPGDPIDGEGVAPGFSCAVVDLFPA